MKRMTTLAKKKHLFRISNLVKLLFSAFCLMLICAPQGANSQTETTKRSFSDKFSFGMRGGLNFPTMIYSNTEMSNWSTEYSQSLTRGAFGVFAELDLSKHISIRPEFMYIGKGISLKGDDGSYTFSPDYLDFRLPIVFNFGKPNGVRPYLMVAPVFGTSLGGTITETDSHYNTYEYNMETTDIAAAEISFLAGAGVKVPINLNNFKLIVGGEVSYCIGLTDNYYDGSIDYDQNGDFLEGTRTNAGLGVMASIAIPLSNFKKKASKPKPVKEPKPEKKPVVKPEPEVIKACYTIDEINALIDAKKNVNNKVICMNNLNFEFNKSTLDKDSKGYLNSVVTLLEKKPTMKMKISGHTDNKGTDEYNLELSKKRSAAVYDYLSSRGIAKERISYEYFGASKPLVPNDSDENRAKNRRVEFEIIEK